METNLNNSESNRSWTNLNNSSLTGTIPKPIRNLEALLSNWVSTSPSPNKNDFTNNLPDDIDDEEEIFDDEIEKENDSPEVLARRFSFDASDLMARTPAIKPKLDSFNFKTPQINTPSLYTPKAQKPLNEPKIQYSIDVRTYEKNYKSSVRKSLMPSQNVKQSVIVNKAKEITNCTSSPPLRQNVIVVNNVTYQVLNELGKGGSSVVFHCYEPLNKMDYAIKCVNLNQDPLAVKAYLNEVQLLGKLQNCERIITMYGYQVDHTQKKLYMILEKGGADLSKVLRDLSTRSSHIPMYMLIYYWMQMLYAVKEIHANGIIHSDLKPANFINTQNGLKLIDFGIASQIQCDMTSVVKDVALGTFNYISPETLKNDSSNNPSSPSFGKQKFKISFKSDVWSLGCILYQLVYGKTPFQHVGHMWAKIAMILDPNHKIDYPKLDWVPLRITDTIKACLTFDMHSRPSIDDLIKYYESYYL